MNRTSFTQRHYELREELIQTNRVFIEVLRRSSLVKSLLRKVQPTIDIQYRRGDSMQCETRLELARNVAFATPVNATNANEQTADIGHCYAPLQDFANHFFDITHGRTPAMLRRMRYKPERAQR